MALRAKWQFMDRSVTHKIVYGPQLRFGPYNTFWVTSRFINCHMALSAMNYLLNNTFILSLVISTPQTQIQSSWNYIVINLDWGGGWAGAYNIQTAKLLSYYTCNERRINRAHRTFSLYTSCHIVRAERNSILQI